MYYICLATTKKQVPQIPYSSNSPYITGCVTIVIRFSVFFIHSSHCLTYLISNPSLTPNNYSLKQEKACNLFSTPMLVRDCWRQPSEISTSAVLKPALIYPGLKQAHTFPTLFSLQYLILRLLNTTHTQTQTSISFE